MYPFGRAAQLYRKGRIFAPIISLKKYKTGLLQIHDSGNVLSHIRSIQEQKATGSGLPDDSFVRLDCIFSLPTINCSVSDLISNRLFTLSNYGFYLFLVMLSMHFTRVREAVNRDVAQ